jgi:hypothetical protein
MLIIGLFTKYFLLLMIIQGLMVGIVDAKAFYKNNMKETAIKARFIGIGYTVLGIVLFLLREMM